MIVDTQILNIHNNSRSMAAFYFCMEILVFFNIIKNGSPFQLRLTEDRYPFFGRVEVNMDNGNGWGTVCDDLWDDTDATVVCKSLGFISGKAFFASAFGSGTGLILMDDVNCTGTEKSLIECSFRNESNCNHIEDAGVICFMADLRVSDNAFHFHLIHIIAYCSSGIIILMLTLAVIIVVCCRRKNSGT